MRKQPILVLSLAIFILIISGGYFYYRYEKKIIRQEQYSNLKTIADLKIDQIMDWREERLADANVIAKSPFIRQNFQRWLLSQDSTLEKNLMERFSLLRYNYKYEDVFVISAEGKLLLDLNTNLKHIDSETIDYCKKALQDKKAFLSDFYFSPARDTIHFDIFAPILNDRNVPVAVLVLRVNPYDYLYPLIQSWPTSSKSAETLIIRRDGDSILYENELRHISNTALRLRIPLTSIKVPAVQAVLGHIGIFEGLDYRGVGVLADIRPVPGTSWFMIAKVDQSEIFSELRYRTVIVSIITILLLLFFGIGISWLNNIRQKNIYRKLLESGTALQESERKFSDTIKYLDQGYYSVTTDGVLIDHNQAFNRIIGIEITLELKGQKTPDFWLDPEDRKQYLNELMAKGFIRNYIVNAKKINGEKIVVLMNSHLVKDENDKLLRIEGTVTDFTRMKLMEEALKERESQYRTLFENAQVGMYRSKIDGSAFLNVNNKCAEIFGFTREELLGAPANIRWANSEDRDKMMRLIKEQGGKLNNYEVSVLGKNGEVRNLLASIELHPGEGYLDGTMIDITERKRAEEALLASEVRYRSYIEATGHIGWVTNADGEVVEDVPSLRKFNGQTYEEAKGSGWAKTLHPDDLDHSLQVWNKAVATKSFYEIEYRMRRHDGVYRYMLARGFPVFKDDGSIMEWVGACIDITDRKRVEEQLRKLNRIYSLLSDINQAIVRIREPKELFEKVCNIAVEQGGFGMAWTGLVDESSQKLRVIAQAGRTNGYHEQLNISLKGEPLSYCPIDSVLRQGKHKICNIIENEEMAPCQKIAYELGFRSSASFPLKVSYILKGTLTLYSDEPDFFDEAELKLLDELALDISFAMEYAEKEAGRKQAEIMLREEKDRIRTILDLVGDPIFVKDNDHRITFANHAFFDIFCLDENSVIGYTLVEAVPENERQHFLEVDRRVLDTGITDIREEELTVRDLTRTIITRKKCFTDESGKRFLVGSIHDITDRKLAEMELQKSEARYKTLVENIPQKIFMKDKDYRWMSINKNFASDLGISPEEIVGKLDNDLFSEELADKYHADDVRIITTGKTEELEEKYVVDGKETWVNTIKTPVRDDKGEIVGLLGIFWDITRRKLAEEEIRKLNAELEDRVVLRTAQLEATNKELEAFSYSVSHDLRAPLRHVSGYVELLNKHFQSDLPEKGHHYLDSISDSVHVMGMLIDDLLQFSRSGRMEMHQSDFDMNKIVKEVKESLSQDNPDRKIEWVQGKLPSVFGDEAMLRLVWTNLLSNAVKFTRTRKKARIEIGVSKEKKELVFFVRDNGVGFDMKYEQKLFGVFQRLHPTEEFEGTGIGLANVQRIVLRHGGRTWAEAEPDKGAAFYFSIPNK